MKFTCYDKNALEPPEQTWISEIREIKVGENHCEMDVTGRGSSFHIIFGQSSRGGYICIPEWGVGSPLASYSDIFWNQEKLSSKIGDVDAITVASAIKEASAIIQKAQIEESNQLEQGMSITL